MNFIYNIAIYGMQFMLNCLAPFNQKIQQGVSGRSETFGKLKKSLNSNDKTLWLHCASLGEYEQGLPVFKALRAHYPEHKIVLTFFSPSGYEIRKNAPIADVVGYLPMDTKANAKRFLDMVHPELTVFVKYEIWPHFLNELKSRNPKAILISASFRKNQPYFKWYGTPLRKALFAFDHVFAQNESSCALLKSIDYHTVTTSGDTRFDRVSDQLQQNNNLNFIEAFKQDKLCVVAGSTWPEDDSLFIDFINAYPTEDVKFIIAPHNLKSTQINHLQEKLKVNTVLFSNKETQDLLQAQVFIIDTIGLLSKIYSYADIAYVGGAMGHTGLHNTLEPAVFGIPIIIGNNHQKFPEAIAMIENGGMFSVSSQMEFNGIANRLISDANVRLTSGAKNKEFINENKGAVKQILEYLHIFT